MKIKVIISIVLILLIAPVINAQSYSYEPSTSVYDGTWRWEGQNKTLFVYINTDKISYITENRVVKVLRVDYEMKDSNGTILYNSKLGSPKEFEGLGATPSFNTHENQNKASGDIFDRGNPNGVFQGIIDLKYVNILGQGSAIIWKLRKYSEQWTGPDDPKDFTLPTDITLTKVE